MFSHIAILSLSILYAVIVLGTAMVVILENRQPAKTIAWVLVIVGLPVAGLIIFYFFGQNIRKERYIGRHTFERFTQSMHHKAVSLEFFQKHERLIFLNERKNRAPFSNGNEISILHDANSFFDRLLQEIGSAQHHVHLMSYIFDDDETGNLIADALIACAQRGIETRLIYDDVGCWKTPKRFFNRMKDAGVCVEPFLPVRFPSLTHRVNYRNHRKVCIIDGKSGFIGGINIADRYRKEDWRDLHLLVEGPSVESLQRIFASDWYFVKEEMLTDKKYFAGSLPNDKRRGGIQMVSSNPVSRYPEIMFGMTWLFQHACRYLYLQTPYFMPTEPVMQALQTAAMSGVDVRLMLPMKPDAFWLRWANNSYLTPILKAGVRVYFYEAGFLHAKCAVADDDWCTVGSTNLDFRSFENNFEANAFIYDQETAKALRKRFENDLAHCKEITLDEWKERPWLQRYLESSTRILSPLL